MPPPPELPPPPLKLPDELLGEVFLRLPTDDPACLLRASLADKSCRRILAHPAFRRRHRELHPTPSVLGFLHNAEGDAPYASRFVPNNPASGRPAARDLPGWRVLDCRHGRALFVAPSPSLGTELSYDLVVWDPLRNEHRCLPPPSPPLTAKSSNHFNACSAAVEGCDHTTCHGGPFRVAFVRWLPDVMSARVFSSETGKWSEAISAQRPVGFMHMTPHPSTLVGDTLYFRCGFGYALEYQLGAQRLSFIEGPPGSVPQSWAISFMPMENGALGCMYVEGDESSLRLGLWSRETASGSDGVPQWTRGGAIELEELLPDGALQFPRLALNLQLLGFAEGTDVIFVGTWLRNHPDAVYMVHLNSGRARKVFDGFTIVVPYTSFCIPVTDASSTTEGPGDNASSA